LTAVLLAHFVHSQEVLCLILVEYPLKVRSLELLFLAWLSEDALGPVEEVLAPSRLDVVRHEEGELHLELLKHFLVGIVRLVSLVMVPFELISGLALRRRILSFSFIFPRSEGWRILSNEQNIHFVFAGLMRQIRLIGQTNEALRIGLLMRTFRLSRERASFDGFCWPVIFVHGRRTLLHFIILVSEVRPASLGRCNKCRVLS